MGGELPETGQSAKAGSMCAACVSHAASGVGSAECVCVGAATVWRAAGARNLATRNQASRRSNRVSSGHPRALPAAIRA
eukprot:2036767-Prymnesium_polylepis.1